MKKGSSYEREKGILDRLDEKVSISELRSSGDAASITISFFDEHLFREFCGSVGENLKILQKNTAVTLVQNGEGVHLQGEPSRVSAAANICSQLLSLIAHGHRLRGAEVDQASRMLLAEPTVQLLQLFRETIFVGQRKKRIYPRSLRQSHYFRSVEKHDLVFGVGPAGTGKTFLAMAMALVRQSPQGRPWLRR